MANNMKEIYFYKIVFFEHTDKQSFLTLSGLDSYFKLMYPEDNYNYNIGTNNKNSDPIIFTILYRDEKCILGKYIKRVEITKNETLQNILKADSNGNYLQVDESFCFEYFSYFYIELATGYCASINNKKAGRFDKFIELFNKKLLYAIPFGGEIKNIKNFFADSIEFVIPDNSCTTGLLGALNFDGDISDLISTCTLRLKVKTGDKLPLHTLITHVSNKKRYSSIKIAEIPSSSQRVYDVVKESLILKTEIILTKDMEDKVDYLRNLLAGLIVKYLGKNSD